MLRESKWGQLIFYCDDHVVVGTTFEVLLPDSFHQSLAVAKLTGQTNRSVFESGIILKSASNEQLIVIAADFPYKLVVLGSPQIAPKGSPEYPLDFYERVVLLG